MLKIEIQPDGLYTSDLKLIGKFLIDYADAAEIRREKNNKDYVDHNEKTCDEPEETMTSSIPELNPNKTNRPYSSVGFPEVIVQEPDMLIEEKKPSINFDIIDDEDIDEHEPEPIITEEKDAAMIFCVSNPVSGSKVTGEVAENVGRGEGSKRYQVADVALDASGLPWDERIHSAGRTKTKNGLWRIKKGVDTVIVDAILSELRGDAVKPNTPLAPPPAPMIPESVVKPEGLFEKFMKLATGAIASKKITTARIVEIIRPYGIEHIPALQARPDIIPQIYATLEGLINNV